MRAKAPGADMLVRAVRALTLFKVKGIADAFALRRGGIGLEINQLLGHRRGNLGTFATTFAFRGLDRSLRDRGVERLALARVSRLMLRRRLVHENNGNLVRFKGTVQLFVKRELACGIFPWFDISLTQEAEGLPVGVDKLRHAHTIKARRRFTRQVVEEAVEVLIVSLVGNHLANTIAKPLLRSASMV